MPIFTKNVRLTLMSLMLIPSVPFAKEIIIDHGYGNEQVIVLEDNQPFMEVVDVVKANLSDNDVMPTKINMEIYLDSDRIHMKAVANNVVRSYDAAWSPNDMEDLTFILGTMAKSSLISIATQRSSLKRAGERIDHLHPLRFLEMILTNEDLKAYVAAVRSKSFVWKEFLRGIVGSLDDESKNKNITAEQLKEFSQKINLDLTPLMPLVKEKNWKEFVNQLIDRIPRDGDTKRYNM